MKIRSADQVKIGGRILYDDGRPGHRRAQATVLAVDARGMTVQFDDRADSTRINFADQAWTDFIEIAAP